MCDTPLGKGVRHRTAVKWAEHSPADALDWMYTDGPDEVETNATIRAVYRRFLLSDPKGAFAWLEAKSEDERRSSKLQGPVGMYLNRKMVSDPMTAIAWTDYLTDEPSRELALISIARRWLKKDPEAAEAWLANSPLSEESRAEAHGPPVVKNRWQKKS